MCGIPLRKISRNLYTFNGIEILDLIEYRLLIQNKT